VDKATCVQAFEKNGNDQPTTIDSKSSRKQHFSWSTHNAATVSST